MVAHASSFGYVKSHPWSDSLCFFCRWTCEFETQCLYNLCLARVENRNWDLCKFYKPHNRPFCKNGDSHFIIYCARSMVTAVSLRRFGRNLVLRMRSKMCFSLSYKTSSSDIYWSTDDRKRLFLSPMRHMNDSKTECVCARLIAAAIVENATS